MDDALRHAFRMTRYCFETPAGALQLTVDCHCPELAVMLDSVGTATMAVLTAFNPAGLLRDNKHNIAAQQALRVELETGGYLLMAGRNVDPTGKWPDEPSLLVVGISLEAAHELAMRYGQAAFLWSDADSATPRLIETAAPAGH